VQNTSTMTEKLESEPTLEKNPVELLMQDHRTVEKLFRKFGDIGEKAFQEKRKLTEKILTELDVHAQVEEEIFYPALEEADDEKYRSMVAEAREEHLVAKNLMEELKALDVEKDQDIYEAKMKVLMESVLHHVEEEERKMLPEAQETLKDRAQDISDEMIHLKSKLMESID
jgi:hemerythrin superfamily protein